jgi:ferredoxin
VDSRKCNGCGACESVCPVRPQRAIRVTALRG